MFSLFVLDLW